MVSSPTMISTLSLTTLFRSLRLGPDADDGREGQRQHGADEHRAAGRVSISGHVAGGAGTRCAREIRGPRDHHRQDPEADRKSTRLNSSHQIISYAVFCLKKK